MEFSPSKPVETYRIRVTVAVYRNNILSYKNEIIIPSEYFRRTEARAHIQKEILERLLHSNFFVLRDQTTIWFVTRRRLPVIHFCVIAFFP